MAVQFIASASAANNGTAATTLSVNKPSNTAQFDVMVAFSGSSIGTGLTSAGWTQIGSTAMAGTDVDCKAWFKVAGAAEAASYSWTCTADNPVVAIATFRGVDNTSPININTADTTNTTQNVTGPAATSTALGLVLHGRYVRDVQNSVQTITSNASLPVAFQAEMHISVPVDVVLGLFYESGPVNSGSQAGSQLNFSHTPTVGQISRTIVLKSAVLTEDLSARASAIHRASRW